MISLEATMDKFARSRILGKSPLGAYLRMNEWIWNRLPRSLAALRPIRSYGQWLHALVCSRADRHMYLGTFFLRNRPELELIRRLSTLQQRPVRIAVLGSSNGAEVYSIAWALRAPQREVDLRIQAVDISPEVLEFARRGVYEAGVSGLVDEAVLARVSDREKEQMFDREGERFRIKPWLQEGITWRLGDAGDPRTAEVLGPQQIVVANRFLCHMRPPEAERCLRNIARLIVPGGYLFVSGIDLDVRTRVANDLGWKAVPDLLEEIHEGDPSLRNSWPCKYWGLEPIDRRRVDWKTRYATVFQLS